MSTNTVFVSLGTNIDREYHLQKGLVALESKYGQLILSSLFECEPVGFIGDHFYNMVIAFDTADSLEEVAAFLRQVEFDNGRPQNAQKFSSRTLDLDILLYGQLVTHEPVQLPRAEISKNAFVLAPLAELATDFIHPHTQLSIEEMWRQFDKQTQPLKNVDFKWNNNEVEIKK